MATVMIAEDDPSIVDVVRAILEIGGYKVATATEGDTLQTIQSNLPDVLLLDIWLSGEDGREICRQLKQNQQTKDLPVILISASKDLEKSAQDAHADDFLAKPFDMHDLLSKVAQHVS